MDIKTRLLRCCGIDLGGGNKCHDGLRCNNCFDKFEGWREIKRLREALFKISSRTTVPTKDEAQTLVKIIVNEARAALKETE